MAKETQTPETVFLLGPSAELVGPNGQRGNFASWNERLEAEATVITKGRFEGWRVSIRSLRVALSEDGDESRREAEKTPPATKISIIPRREKKKI